MSIKHLVIPDVQVKPEHNTDYLEWAGKYAVEKKPDVIICIGDFWDMPSLSSYDVGKKSFEGRKYKDDIEAGKLAMQTFLKPIKAYNKKAKKSKKKQYTPRLVFTLGNHECLDDSAEVLTKHRGFVNITEVTTDDEVWTLAEEGIGEWQQPSLVFSKPYSGNMYEINTRSISIKCTEGHRFYTKTSGGNLIVREAKDLPSNYSLYTSANYEGEFVSSYTKEDVKLGAWLCTDSHFTKGNQVVLYQRESNAHKIRDLLNTLNIEYKETRRDRDITHICGKELKNKPESSVEFFINKKDVQYLMVHNNSELPDWSMWLGEELWEEFLSVLIEADGSIPTKAQTSRVFYGKKEICESLQQAALVHGWSASITEYRKNQFRVNLCKRVSRRLENVVPEVTHYEGLVHCLTVPNGNFMMRRNNKCHFTGNCRIERAVESDRKLEDLISYDDFGLEKDGWEVIPYLQPIVIDGVAYSHFFTSGVMGRPVSSAKLLLNKKHMSCVMGHVQNRDIAFDKRADGKQMTGLFSGIFYPHDEGYLNAQTNGSWSGIWMLHDVRDGEFDEMPISMRYLEKKYG